MAKLLYIESSPRKERSHSIAVSRAFLDAYAKAHPGDTVETWDLWAKHEQLPEFDGAALTAKYATMFGQAHSTPEADAWAAIGISADRLKSADKLVISAPMWNFGVPYKLKHLVDVVTQPGLTFKFDPATGYTGLLPAQKALIISARAGAWAPGTPMAPMDMEATYIERWMKFIGVADVKQIYVEPTAAAPDQVAATRQKAIDEAVSLAAAF